MSIPFIKIDGYWLALCAILVAFMYFDFERYAMGEQSRLWGKRTVVCEVAK